MQSWFLDTGLSCFPDFLWLQNWLQNLNLCVQYQPKQTNHNQTIKKKAFELEFSFKHFYSGWRVMCYSVSFLLLGKDMYNSLMGEKQIRYQQVSICTYVNKSSDLLFETTGLGYLMFSDDLWN